MRRFSTLAIEMDGGLGIFIDNVMGKAGLFQFLDLQRTIYPQVTPPYLGLPSDQVKKKTRRQSCSNWRMALGILKQRNPQRQYSIIRIKAPLSVVRSWCLSQVCQWTIKELGHQSLLAKPGTMVNTMYLQIALVRVSLLERVLILKQDIYHLPAQGWRYSW